MTTLSTIRDLVFSALTNADDGDYREFVRGEAVETVGIDLIDYDAEVFNAVCAADLGAGDLIEHVQAWREENVKDTV